MRRVNGLAVAVSVLALASGCSAAPEPLPSAGGTPTPTYSCTPEAGGTPSPCSPEQYTEQTRLNVLYAEAGRNYQRFFTEYVRLMRAGGADKASPNLAAVAGGPYLEAQVTHLREMQALGVKAGPGDVKLVKADRSPGATSRGYEIALATCVDSRAVPLMQGDQVLKQGRAYAETVYFKRDGGILKLWDAEGKPVESC